MSMLGLPVVAMVPQINARLSSVARGQLVHLDARAPASEAYRLARTALHLGTGGDPKTILVASPAAGDGKSTAASNLAIAFAQAGERTLLMDCDLREPVQQLIFEANGSVGMSSVIRGEEKLRDAICATRVKGLYLLPCGPIPTNPSELLAGKKFNQLMRALIGMFDRIIIDSPPLMAVTDGRILAASADATLLVLRMNQSARDQGILALAGLEKVGANVVGAIANDVAARNGYAQVSGSWRYATSAKRLLSTFGGRSFGGEGNGNGNGNGHALAASALRPMPGVDLDIDEPDWSAEPQ
jgi:capsular exopolysaccharide synthesis family protein